MARVEVECDEYCPRDCRRAGLITRFFLKLFRLCDCYNVCMGRVVEDDLDDM